MVYVKTDVQKNLILKNDAEKLDAEVRARSKQLGLRDMIPQNNQNAYQQLEDMKNESSHIQELMREAKEKRLKKNEEKRKELRKPFNEQLRLYFQRIERQNAQQFAARRIVFRDGGFDRYESGIRMVSCRALLRQLETGEVNCDGIVVNARRDRFPRFVVISVGEGFDDLIPGDVVVVEPWSGTEIVSKNLVYRIVTVGDVLARIEE